MSARRPRERLAREASPAADPDAAVGDSNVDEVAPSPFDLHQGSADRAIIQALIKRAGKLESDNVAVALELGFDAREED
jgi:hypothetical protein